MQQRNPRLIRDMTILGGWLFADLLLALTVIFMAAQPAFPKPLPTPNVATPTPTLPPHLESGVTTVTIPNVDFNGIRSNSASAVRYVENFINSRPMLQGRRAGVVIVYDGAPNDTEIQNAFAVDRAIISHVLQPMSKQTVLFGLSSFYKNPLFVLGEDPSTVTLDIYLFAQ